MIIGAIDGTAALEFLPSFMLVVCRQAVYFSALPLPNSLLNLLESELSLDTNGTARFPFL
ncbi:hypothetical protein HG15A2_37670 [Adhaeretor mobilis]|uniref:Uncharacterized protein n=1 Tax=Adhaeretor mobilis TaxID=1930276 RepID=A0A517MZW9_9BACT|nr:hypothetical protein HG15A2_37670 [Adhaeretor mobilis]